MFTQLKAFVNTQPEIVFQWKDTETEAVGWLVINSLRNGASGGGTRMRKGCTLEEITSLTKTMEIRFNVSGPPIGGAMSGIDFDPEDDRKTGVLTRWYQAILPMLRSYYGTSGELNVDEFSEVLPITHKLGIVHPQEGIVSGFMQPPVRKKKALLERLRQSNTLVLKGESFAGIPGLELRLADMAAGFGVAEAVQHYYRIWDQPTHQKRVIIQGFGDVGGAAALTLAKQGYKIVGIIDKAGGMLEPKGIDLATLQDLYKHRRADRLPGDHIMSYNQLNMSIWSIGAEIFIPAADSGLVTKYQLDEMMENGLEVISCGANAPFNDPDLFLGDTGLYADNRVVVIPDFIANCGMARVFAYFMDASAPADEVAILQDISDTIGKALEKTHVLSPQGRGIWQHSLQWVLEELIGQSVLALEK